jgi:hypothetical protein
MSNPNVRIIYKTGVLQERDGYAVCDEIKYAITVIADSYNSRGYELVITSLLDGTHNKGSLHPLGRAVDCRSWTLDSGDRQAIFDELKTKLYPLGFDVVYEGCKGATPATTAQHMHAEYDPKPGREFSVAEHQE